MGLGLYDGLGEYFGPLTASSVFQDLRHLSSKTVPRLIIQSLVSLFAIINDKIMNEKSILLTTTLSNRIILGNWNK